MGAAKTARRFKPVPVQDCAPVSKTHSYHNMIRAFWEAGGKPFLVMRCGQRLQGGSWCTLARLTLKWWIVRFLQEFFTLKWNGRRKTLLPQPLQLPVSGATSAHCQNLGGWALSRVCNPRGWEVHSGPSPHNPQNSDLSSLKGMTPWRSLKRKSWLWTRAWHTCRVPISFMARLLNFLWRDLCHVSC